LPVAVRAGPGVQSRDEVAVSGLLEGMMRRWRYRAAIRAEHTLEPTLRRRLDRVPEAWAARRALRQDRRLRTRSPSDIDALIAQQWTRILGR
jgi:hypothetical protein